MMKFRYRLKVSVNLSLYLNQNCLFGGTLFSVDNDMSRHYPSASTTGKSYSSIERVLCTFLWRVVKSRTLKKNCHLYLTLFIRLHMFKVFRFVYDVNLINKASKIVLIWNQNNVNFAKKNIKSFFLLLAFLHKAYLFYHILSAALWIKIHPCTYIMQTLMYSPKHYTCSFHKTKAIC